MKNKIATAKMVAVASAVKNMQRFSISRRSRLSRLTASSVPQFIPCVSLDACDKSSPRLYSLLLFDDFSSLLFFSPLFPCSAAQIFKRKQHLQIALITNTAHNGHVAKDHTNEINYYLYSLVNFTENKRCVFNCCTAMF